MVMDVLKGRLYRLSEGHTMNSTALKPHIVHPVIAHLLCDVYWNVCRRCARL